MNEKEFLINLCYCNSLRFVTPMLANRTIHEFANFVSQSIFNKNSEEYKFTNRQKDIYPFKEGTGIKEEFIIWSKLFRRFYDYEIKK